MYVLLFFEVQSKGEVIERIKMDFKPAFFEELFKKRYTHKSLQENGVKYRIATEEWYGPSRNWPYKGRHPISTYPTAMNIYIVARQSLSVGMSDITHTSMIKSKGEQKAPKNRQEDC